MRNIVRSNRFLWLTVLVAAYWVVALFVPAVPLAQVITLLVIGGGIGVIIKYSRQVIEDLRADDRGPISQLAQGILLAFVGLVIGITWAIVGRLVPGAEWMRASPVTGFYLWLYVIASGLHITARRDSHGMIRREDWRTLVVCYGLALIIGLALLVLQMGGVLRGFS
jgi:hypothetical protein